MNDERRVVGPGDEGLEGKRPAPVVTKEEYDGAYRRLSTAQVYGTAYGDKLREAIMGYLTQKLEGDPADRLRWLRENFNLGCVDKKLYDASGAPVIAASRLLSLCFQTGAEDYVPLLRHVTDAVSAQREAGADEEMDQGIAQMRGDIEIVARYFGDKYQVEI